MAAIFKRNQDEAVSFFSADTVLRWRLCLRRAGSDMRYVNATASARKRNALPFLALARAYGVPVHTLVMLVLMLVFA